jgi:ABC-type nitrate/sulfonate/bicarbonate transport system substrate-binding protein
VVGYAPRLASLPQLVVADFMAKDGYQPDWKFFDSRALTQAFVTGVADIALITPVQAAQINEAGVRVRLLTVAWGSLDWVFVASDRYKTLAELNGKVIGISTPGTSSEFLVRRLLASRGFDPDKHVTYASIGATGARAAALVSGRIQATWLGYDAAFEVLRRGGFHVLDNLSVTQVFPGYVNLTWAAKTAYIDRNPSAVRSLVKAQILANRWAQNKEAFLARAARSEILEIRTVSREAAEWSYDRYIKDEMFPVNGGLSPKSIATALQIGLMSGEIKAMPKYSDIVAADIQESVLSEIGSR